MCGIELTKVAYTLRRNQVNDPAAYNTSSWGWYFEAEEVEGVKIGGAAGSNLGYLKINLWK